MKTPAIKKNTTEYLFFFLLFTLVATMQAQVIELPDRPAKYPLMPDTQIKNVIVFIGDGMGISHLTTSRVKNVGANGWYTIELMPVTGFIRTNSADHLVTDSGASATAYATGYKTRNHMISVSPDSLKLKTIMEAAKEKGMATGLVSLRSAVTDATPAAFLTHVTNRTQRESIAAQFLSKRVNVLFGGDKNRFLPESLGGTRKDGRNIIDEAEKAGYTVVNDDMDKLMKAKGDHIWGFFTADGPADDKIVGFTKKAISALSGNENGFIMMIESGVGDHGGHRNDPEIIIKGLRQFDYAVKEAIEFAEKDKHTLIIVTADHETGGLAVNSSKDNWDLKPAWTTKGHTGQPTPLFAFGPHALEFTGMHDNTELPRIIAKLLNLKSFPQKLNEKVD